MPRGNQGEIISLKNQQPSKQIVVITKYFVPNLKDNKELIG